MPSHPSVKLHNQVNFLYAIYQDISLSEPLVHNSLEDPEPPWSESQPSVTHALTSEIQPAVAKILAGGTIRASPSSQMAKYSTEHDRIQPVVRQALADKIQTTVRQWTYTHRRDVTDTH